MRSEPTPAELRRRQVIKATRDAFLFASSLSRELAAAGHPGDPVETQVERLVRAFTAWPSLCRRMAALQDLAPRSAAEGLEYAQKIVDAQERAQAAQGDR